MLSYEQKVAFLENYLLTKNDSYSDSIKEDIYFYFFEREVSPDFLNQLNSEKEIEQKIDLVVSKTILHEHEDGLEDIIQHYL
ncbi:hypothetical protein AD998_06035 [bacterium 336/3]|nr:hypothetical protein AD998_06035 [bacterium 336/3]